MFTTSAVKAASAALATILFITSVLTGCGGGGSAANPASGNNGEVQKAAEKPVTISFWLDQLTPEKDQFIKEQIVKPFEAKYPNIKVDFLGVPGPLGDKIRVALAAGSPPDVSSGAMEFRAQGALEPLDAYFEQSPLKDKINEEAVRTIRSLDAKEGKLYGIPTSLLVWCVWIRPDWYKEANLKIPETWDEFFDAAHKLTDKSKGRYGFTIRGGQGSAGTLEHLMYSYSGLTEFFTKDGKSTINDPLHVEFVEKFLGMYNVVTPEDDVTKGFAEIGATFTSGKAAMYVQNLGSGIRNEAGFQNDYSKFQAIPFPRSVKGYVVLPSLTGRTTPMFKDSKNKEAAWKFIEFFADQEQNSKYAKLISEIPLNKDIADTSWMKEKPYMEMASQLINSPDTKFYQIPNYMPEYSTIRNEQDSNIQKVMLQKMTAQELLDNWAMKLEKAKADFDAGMKK